MKGLETGKWKVHAWSDEMVLETPPEIEIPGFGSISQDLTLGKGREIRGRLLACDGKPLVGARLVTGLFGVTSLDGEELDSARAVSSDSSGRFALKGLPLDRRRFDIGVKWPGCISRERLDVELIETSPARIQIVIRATGVETDLPEGGDGIQIHSTTPTLSVEFPPG